MDCILLLFVYWVWIFLRVIFLFSFWLMVIDICLILFLVWGWRIEYFWFFIVGLLIVNVWLDVCGFFFKLIDMRFRDWFMFWFFSCFKFWLVLLMELSDLRFSFGFCWCCWRCFLISVIKSNFVLWFRNVWFVRMFLMDFVLLII